MQLSTRTANILLSLFFLLGCSSDVPVKEEAVGPSNENGHSEEGDVMKTFDQLYEELQEYRKSIDVMISSRIEDHNDCDAFREIVARGDEFLPRVVEEIEKGDFFLNQAMEEITGLSIFEIYPDERIVGAQDASRLWLRWWKSKSETPLPEDDEESGSSDAQR